MNAICRICAAAVFLAGSTPAFGATISIAQNPAWTYTAAGISPTVTNGNQIDGMRVTAVVSNGTSLLTLTQTWADTADPDTGGVSFVTPELALSVTGDSFEANNWLLDLSSADGWRLLSLSLDGSSGQTVFDRTFGGSTGTPNSASGRDFAGFTTFSGSIAAFYGGAVGIAGNAPVGDLFANILLSFGDGSFANALTAGRQYHFSLDTDNTTSALVPEAGSLLLLASGLLGMGTALRRRQT